MTIKVLSVGGPGGAGIEDILDAIFGPSIPIDPNAPKTHFLVYDDLGDDKPMYHRIRTEEEMRIPGNYAPSTLTPLITEATPYPQKEAEAAVEMIKESGPCTCDDEKCFGRFVKVRAIPVPEGWAPTKPIMDNPTVPVQ